MRRRNLAGAAIAALVVSVGGVASPGGSRPRPPERVGHHTGGSRTSRGRAPGPRQGQPGRPRRAERRPAVAGRLAGDGALEHPRHAARRSSPAAPRQGRSRAACRPTRRPRPASTSPRNQDLFGLDEKPVAAMERLLVRPIGTGAVVLLRQRFGDLPAGHDGLVGVLVNNGAVRPRHLVAVPRHQRARNRPRSSAADGGRPRPCRRRARGRPGRRRAGVRLVAVPTPARRAARRVRGVVQLDRTTTTPTSFTTYVDARTGGVLVREDQVDFDSDNPQWAVFPATPPPSGADTRERWCFSAGAPAACAPCATRTPARRGTSNVATGAPTFTSSGNSANNVVQWGGGTPAIPATPSPDRNYIYPFTDQWHQARCNPDVFTSAQRNDADAAVEQPVRHAQPDARLGVPPRVHRGRLEHAGGQRQPAPASAATPSRAGRRPARSPAAATTPTRAPDATACRRRRNMFLWQPVAGGGVPAVRRRRLRHDRDRPRVHATRSPTG